MIIVIVYFVFFVDKNEELVAILQKLVLRHVDLYQLNETSTKGMLWNIICHIWGWNFFSWPFEMALVTLWLVMDHRLWMVKFTVSAQIEHHSWLERQDAHFGCTVVIFGRFLRQKTLKFAQFFAKNYKCAFKKYPLV